MNKEKQLKKIFKFDTLLAESVPVVRNNAGDFWQVQGCIVFFDGELKFMPTKLYPSTPEEAENHLEFVELGTLARNNVWLSVKKTFTIVIKTDYFQSEHQTDSLTEKRCELKKSTILFENQINVWCIILVSIPTIFLFSV